MYRLSGAERVRRVEEVLRLVGMWSRRDDSVHKLSGGMKQRVSLARAIIHNPMVLILDEPAAGLDPRARIELRETLKVLAAKGKAIFISSHILSELAEMCDNVVIIEKGKILKAGGIGQISQQKNNVSIMIRSTSDLEQIRVFLQKQDTVINAKVLPGCVAAEIKGDEKVSGKILTALIQEGFEIIEIKHMKSTLEDIFMDITKGEVA
ncbi:MAG TPA: hypothetical protein DCP47_02130 [Phycisphaerales bacterium]|nr:hypothetical protein [Phycisphaerales bacterium]